MLTIIVQVLVFILEFIGMVLIFKKFKVNPLWALVPVVDRYKIAQCADNEDSGAVWCISSFIVDTIYCLVAVLDTLKLNTAAYYYIAISILLLFGIIFYIYSIRVYVSLCSVLGLKKRWVLLLLCFRGLTLFYIGISKKINPVIKTVEKSADESGRDVEVLEEGLTINIKERSVRRNLFSKRTLLKDVHMNIAPGRMVLLLGGSGAGKTTLINAITGYEKANASIILNGNNVYSDYSKVIYDIGIVPQQELIRTTDTVYRTLLDSATLRMPSTVSSKDRKNRVNEVMDIFGLTPVKNNLVGKQSGGQKKRISIAMEYISDPSLFILDEPDSGLDGILAKELMRKLHDISREGKIVIVVTHTPDRVIDLFDDVIVLAKDNERTGRLVFYGPVDEAKTFFDADSMEEIVKTINRIEEGGLGRADELLAKYNKEVGINE